MKDINLTNKSQDKVDIDRYTKGTLGVIAAKQIGEAMVAKDTGLKRQRHPMPGFVEQALNKGGLMDAYRERPAYQQNDYIGWINAAKLQKTKEKRLCQMLEELETGGVYMKMAHSPSRKNK